MSHPRMSEKTAEFFLENPHWTLENASMERPRSLLTTRFISDEVSLSGSGYRWDIDDNYDHLIDTLLGISKTSATLEMELDNPGFRKIVSELGGHSLSLEIDGFYLADLSVDSQGSVCHIPEKKMMKLYRLDEFFDRSGFMTISQAEAQVQRAMI